MRVPRNTPHIHVRTFQFFLEQTDSLQAAGALGDGGEAVEQVEVLDEHVVAVRYQVGPVGTRSAAVGRGRELEVGGAISVRSEEHTSELQSLMRISYSVFCLKKNTK